MRKTKPTLIPFGPSGDKAHETLSIEALERLMVLDCAFLCVRNCAKQN
jgi:hypothetical protein